MTERGYVGMWHVMEALQTRYLLTQHMISTILRRETALNSLPSVSQTKVSLLDEVKDFLDKGADADGMPGASMLRPLHAAAKVGNADVTQVLLEAGADVNTIDAYNNRAPLHYAAESNVQSVQILVKNGAEPNLQDGDGNTALHWAAYKNKFDSVKCLLQHKASVNAMNLNGDSPLSFASMRGNSECVKILLDFGADVTLRNMSGKTALIRAAITQYGDLNSYDDNICFELLMKASGRLVLATPSHYHESMISHSDRDLYHFLVSIASEVTPLSHLCRATIRQQLINRYMPDAVRSLRLPKEIEKFLLLLDKR